MCACILHMRMCVCTHAAYLMFDFCLLLADVELHRLQLHCLPHAGTMENARRKSPRHYFSRILASEDFWKIRPCAHVSIYFWLYFGIKCTTLPRVILGKSLMILIVAQLLFQEKNNSAFGARIHKQTCQFGVHQQWRDVTGGSLSRSTQQRVGTKQVVRFEQGLGWLSGWSFRLWMWWGTEEGLETGDQLPGTYVHNYIIMQTIYMYIL